VTPDDQYREKLLMASIDEAERSCSVVVTGIEATLEELYTFRSYLGSLLEAQYNLRSGKYTVSLSEYGKIKKEIIEMDGLIKKQDLALRQQKHFFKEKIKEAERLREQLRTFRNFTRRGVILNFSKDTNGKK
jgi:hypothetical protein